MNLNDSFSRNDTLRVKGVAIMMLVIFHCLSKKSRLYGAKVDFWPFSRAMGMQISFTMALCVGIFAFLSAYGLALSMKKRYPSYEFTSHQAVLYVIRRYLVLLTMFFLPFVFCTAVTLATGQMPYKGDILAQISHGLLDMLGLSDVFSISMMTRTWWYFSLLLIITVFMPLCIRAYKKYGWLTVPMALLAGSILLKPGDNRTKWLLVVPIAVCFADGQVLERLKGWKMTENPAVNKILKFLLVTAVLVLLILIRTTDYAKKGHIQFGVNGVTATIAVWWLYEFVVDIPGLGRILQFLGKHSADIFFIHTFIRSKWLRELTYSFPYAIQIWLFVLLSALAISIFLDLVRRVIRYDKLSSAFTEKVLVWADRAL